MKRLFAAIKVHPGEEFLKSYYFLKKSLDREKIKWVDPANIHITMKFFGETPEHHIPGINAALRQASEKISPLKFEIADTGIFGSSYKPRVIWFGIQPREGLISMANIIFDELEKIGIEKDRQNFVPHLTMARIKFIQDKKLLQAAIDKHKNRLIQKEEVNEFHLFESILRPEGPKYEIIDSFTLSAP